MTENHPGRGGGYFFCLRHARRHASQKYRAVARWHQWLPAELAFQPARASAPRATLVRFRADSPIFHGNCSPSLTPQAGSTCAFGAPSALQGLLCQRIKTRLDNPRRETASLRWEQPGIAPRALAGHFAQPQAYCVLLHELSSAGGLNVFDGARMRHAKIIFRYD
jgi:hypothetical protein